METIQQFKFLEGGGEMGELIRAHNWNDTPLGPVENWPRALKISVGIMLASPFPMYIAWGKEYTQLYNDGYRPILGSLKHPQALGAGTSYTFPEIWHIVGPLFDGVMQGKAVHFPNFKFDLNRHGYLEECWFDFSYSPIPDEDGHIGGVLVTVVEITEKIKASADLKAAKEHLEWANAASERERDRLKRFFMEAPAGICILDGPSFVFELINPPYQQLFPGRNLLGKPLLEALPELAGQPIADIITSVYKTGKTFHGNGLKVPLAREHGGKMEDRYFNFVYQARMNAAGTVDGVMVFVFEVMEMFTTRLLLAESESRFRSMVEQSPVPMLVVLGPELVFNEFNKPMLELIDRGEWIRGKPVYEVLPELKGQPIMDRLYHTLNTGEEWTGLEIPILLKRRGEQTTGYFNISYKPLWENQTIVGVLQSAIEVTEQVTARQQLEKTKDTLRLSLAAARLGTFDLDLEQGIMHWDQRCRELFGIDHQHEVNYEADFVNGLHPDDRERILNIINNEVFVRDVSNGEYDVVYRTVGASDKKIRWVRAMGKAYFNQDDKPVRFIGSVLDITESKEDELRKNDFIGMVSHELKTPLTSLKGYIQLAEHIARANNYGNIPDLMSRADGQLNKMNDQVHGFLNLSRLESGKIFLDKQPFEMGELASSVVSELQLTTSTHQIKINNFSNPVQVVADRDKIESVMSNLISNAIKYSEAGSAIEVSWCAKNGAAAFTVKDNGIGIKPQDLERIFERYYRVDGGSKMVSGFGIGLYLSAEIIRRHGGTIHVESEPGKGSTFSFELPMNL